MTADLHDLDIDWGDCATCGEDPTHEHFPPGECPKSLRPCGHHCNHVWDQDVCHWCGAEVNDDGDLVLRECEGGGMKAITMSTEGTLAVVLAMVLLGGDRG